MTQATFTGFQGVVNNQPGVAEAGDFYGANPRAIVLAGPGEYSAPVGGLTVGNFCWVNPSTGAVSQSYVAGYIIGFLRRGNNAVIVNFLAPATMQVLQGLPITLYSQGDFWAKFDGGATAGQLVYADPDSGAPISAASAPTSSSGTGTIGFTGTGTLVSGSAVLTIATAVDGVLSVGDTVTGTQIPASTTILNQLTGTPGGVGTYTMSANASATVSSAETITSTSTVLNLTALTTGAFGPGDIIAGSGVTSGTSITAQLSGTQGGVGTYSITPAQNVASAAISITAAGILTPWKVNSSCAAGEIAKISTWS